MGLKYHPSTGSDTYATPPKIKFKTCIRFDGISAVKMTDVAFWSLAFALWLKDPPSEYHRVEVIYFLGLWKVRRGIEQSHIA
jgi:hypothetical protein